MTANMARVGTLPIRIGAATHIPVVVPCRLMGRRAADPRGASPNYAAKAVRDERHPRGAERHSAYADHPGGRMSLRRQSPTTPASSSPMKTAGPLASAPTHRRPSVDGRAVRLGCDLQRAAGVRIGRRV